jgi:hypothetical protein
VGERLDPDHALVRVVRDEPDRKLQPSDLGEIGVVPVSKELGGAVGVADNGNTSNASPVHHQHGPWRPSAELPTNPKAAWLSQIR